MGHPRGRGQRRQAETQRAPEPQPKEPKAKAAKRKHRDAGRAESSQRSRRGAKRKADHQQPDDAGCLDESEEMWGDVDVEDVDDSENEDSSDQEAGFHGRRDAGGNGTSESDRVYQQLLRQGAEPAVIGQKRKASSNQDEVEMELFTPDAAKKARLIPDEGRRPMRMGMGGMGIPSFSSFFF
ncbi:unnamed protein product [Symbiodinium sp. CCMP2592]|nr:unnamed protein product [Symbiodinium sp. CCMP2592]